MKKISFFLLFISSILSFSQSKEKIVVVQQDQIFFYRIGDYKDSILLKDHSDLFLIKMSADKKASTEIKLKNATFLKTNDAFIFKLVYTPGMRYRLIYPNIINEKNKNQAVSKNSSEPNEPKIETDGANTDGSKEIEIELLNLKTDKIMLKNIFYFKEN